MTAHRVVIILAVWTALSVPVAIAVGRRIAHLNNDIPSQPTNTQRNN